MTVARKKHVENVVLGNGEIYFDQLVDGKYTGERYLGDIVNVGLEVTVDISRVFSGTGSVPRQLASTLTSSAYNLGWAVQDSSIANWAMFLMGDDASGIAARSAAGSEVADEAINIAIKAGRTFVLGQSPAAPFGVGKVKSVSVKSAQSGSNAVNAGDDTWQVDPDTGRITFFADYATGVRVTYTPEKGQVGTRMATASSTPKSLRGAVRYIEDDPGAGKGRHLYIRKALVAPQGRSEFASRDTSQQNGFSAATEESGDAYPDITIDGEEL